MKWSYCYNPEADYFPTTALHTVFWRRRHLGLFSTFSLSFNFSFQVFFFKLILDSSEVCVLNRNNLHTHPLCSQKEWTHSRLFLSQIFTVLSSLAETINLPSGENLQQETTHRETWWGNVQLNIILHNNNYLIKRNIKIIKY